MGRRTTFHWGKGGLVAVAWDFAEVTTQAWRCGAAYPKSNHRADFAAAECRIVGVAGAQRLQAHTQRLRATN